jgi:hypothetical protein
MLEKKIFRLFAIVAILFFCTILISYAMGQRRGEKIKGNPPELKIELQLFKTQYLLREPIWARCKVTNIGAEPGKFYFDNLDALVIMDSKGKVYPCSIAIERIPITIKLGQTLEKEGNLLGYYGVPETKFRIQRYLPPEKYIVYYELNQTVGSEKYKVYAKSQIDTFEVLESKGDELKAMNLLKESHDLRIQKKNKESLEKLKELIRKYPNSRYYLYALLLTAGNLEAWHDLIKRFPDSREGVQAVGSIALTYQYNKDKRGYMDAMNNLIKKYPDSDIAREAERNLKHMRDEDFE